MDLHPDDEAALRSWQFLLAVHVPDRKIDSEIEKLREQQRRQYEQVERQINELMKRQEMEQRLSRREYEDLAKNRLFIVYLPLIRRLWVYLGQWIKQFGIKDVVFREYEFYVYGLPFSLDIIKSKVFQNESPYVVDFAFNHVRKMQAAFIWDRLIRDGDRAIATRVLLFLI